MNMHINTFEQLYIIQQNGDKKKQIYQQECFIFLKTLNSFINLQLDVLGLEETVTKKI